MTAKKEKQPNNHKITSPLDKRRLNPGAKKLKDKSFSEYDTKIKLLAERIAQGIPPSQARKDVEISSYQLNRYMSLKPFQKEVEYLAKRYQTEEQMDDNQKWIEGYKRLEIAVVESAIRLAENDKLPWIALKEVMMARAVMLGLIKGEEGEPGITERSITVKEKTSFQQQLKEISVQERAALIGPGEGKEEVEITDEGNVDNDEEGIINEEEL